MLKQGSLNSTDVTYIYEDSFVWVHLNSIKKGNGALYRAIYEYYKDKNTLFYFFKGQVKEFVSNDEVKVYVYIDDECDKIKKNEDTNYELIENVKYLLPVDTNFGCSDNTELIYLNSPNLLENVYQRYLKAYSSEQFRNCIYTYIGYILISVNPYQNFDIYCDEYMNKVRQEENLFNIPHPFSIANDAYHCLIKDQVSQSIVISGESGSGKTESSKQVLKYLTYLSQYQKEEEKKKLQGKNKRKSERAINNIITYEEKVQNSNPLLESFGNAKTIKNDNSSRFGKLMKLNYDEKGILCSASIETYLLAKSRVVDVPYGESNYHIFYSLCENKEIAKEFQLLPWYNYNYLVPKKKADGSDQKKRQLNIKEEEEEEAEEGGGGEKGEYYKRNEKGKTKKKGKKEFCMEEKEYKCLYDLDVIIQCFNSIGIFEQEQKEIFKTLICILLLGNVDFIESEKEGEALKIKNIEVCKSLNKILELQNDQSDVQKIIEILTIKKVRETKKNYTYQQAIYNRDVIAKALYHLLFEYIIFRVNDSLNKKEDEDTVSKKNKENKNNVKGEKNRNKRRKKSKEEEKGHEEDDEEDETEEEREEKEETILAEELNSKLFHDKQKKYFIGILDIYGFENFSSEGINGYEQLCINYANEILHSFFLKQIIDNEHKIHCEEDLNIQKFHYNDNSAVISLIGDARDSSIYGLLEDMALLSSSNKSTEKNKKDIFFERLNKNVINIAKYKSVIRPYSKSNRKNCFIINHYAGDVLYDTSDFVNKNMDILTTDIENFLTDCNYFISNNLLKRIKYEICQNDKSVHSSSDEKKQKKKEMISTGLKIDANQSKRKLSVREMISNKEIENKPTVGNQMNSNIHKNKVKSIFSYFKKQLEILTNKLNKTSSKFIRCIKSNHYKKALVFDKNLVLNQLIMSGMVDILNLMKNGFPCRVLYDDIWINYSNILQDEMKEYLTPKTFCEIVLKFLEINNNEYRFGKTKVFFRFGVLSIINKILNKNEDKKNAFLHCVYRFWLQRRKRRLLNFVLFGCRFKILFKKKRAKLLMDSGLQLYDTYLFHKKMQNIEIILYYYFNVYKERCYFLELKKSSIVIQKNIRCYFDRKRYLQKKKKILLIQDYYLFHKYFMKRVKAANVIRKNWLMYITKYDYQYVLKCIRLIQRALRNYLKKRYLEYCLKGSLSYHSNLNGNKPIIKNVLVKQELEEDEKEKTALLQIQRTMSQKQEEADNRMCSFIYIDKKKQRPKHRSSFALGERINSLEKRRLYQENVLKRRKTWNLTEDISNYECNMVHTYKYKHQKKLTNSGYKINVLTADETNASTKGKLRNSFNEDVPIISVGNIIINEKTKNNSGNGRLIRDNVNSICNTNINKRDINKRKEQQKYMMSNLSICGTSNSSNLYLKNRSRKDKADMKRKSCNQFHSKNSFPSSYQRDNKKATSFVKNTIYDRYIDKYKMNHSNKQTNKKKKSLYMKKNYSNISNIYSVLKPPQLETSTEQYNFDVTDELLIPDNFFLYESTIPEPPMELQDNVHYKNFCKFLDQNVKSQIPIIPMSFFKINR